MSRQDGRTSDLIRRFESLALEKGGGSSAVPKPQFAAKRVSVTAAGDASPTKQPGDVGRRGSDADKAAGGERTPLASLAAAQSALSAAIAHAQPSPSAARQRSPSLAEHSGARTEPLRGSPRPRAPSDSPESAQVAKNGTADSAPTIDAAAAGPQSKGDTPIPRSKRLLSVLNKRAEIDPSLQVSNNTWLTFAESCIDEGRMSQEASDPENAYLRYMVACNIFTKKFGNLRGSNPIIKDPAYVRLRKAVGTYVVSDLEKLHKLLEGRTCDETEPGRGWRLARQADAQPMTAEQLDRMESRFSQLYPEDPHAAPQSLLHAGLGGGDSDSVSTSQAQAARQVEERQSRFDEIDAQVRSIDAGVQNLRPREGSLPGVAIIGQNPTNKRVATAVSPLLSAASEGSPANGVPAWYIDPNTTTCTPRELWSLLDRSRTGVHGRPTILLLDVRAHQDHVWGHIDHRYVVNVDPAGLHAKCTSADIASALVLVSDEQQRWFRRRGEFDLVVYVSQSMRSFSDAASRELGALESLNSAIYHYEYEKPLKHPPLFLIGGFDAWTQEVGTDRCLWSESAQKVRTAVPSHAGAPGPSAGGVAAQPLHTSSHPPAAPPALAALGRSNTDGAGVGGSVFDFFQQANGHQQHGAQGDSRHRPAHASVTHSYGVQVPGAAAVAGSASTGELQYARPQGSANVGTAPTFWSGQLSTVQAAQLGTASHSRTVFDNPTYGFTAPVYAGRSAIGYPTVEPPRAVAAMGYTPTGGLPHDSAIMAEKRAKRRAPPPVPLPLPHQPQLPPKPAAYAQQRTEAAVEHASQPSVPATSLSSAVATVPAPVLPRRQQMESPAHATPMMQQQQQQHPPAHAPVFYNHPVAAGSDPSLNGRMHASANLRSSIAYDQQALLSPGSGKAGAPAAVHGMAVVAAPQLPRRTSQLSDTAAYGATGLKNFGNTCFMNCVIQCLIGTGPLTRYFLRGEWKRSVLRDNKKARDVTVEFARLIENMWRGQYGSISPVGFRAAVANFSEQFKGNDQEDAHEFASFLLDTLHETMNQVHPRPATERESTAEEEQQFERLAEEQQALVRWKRSIRRDWSIVTSIFQGQIQSRLTCLSCKHTSTTYHTFTELSVPIPKVSGQRNGMALVRKGQQQGHNNLPVNIYQCLDAYSETELLDGDNKWACPHCKTKRKATKRLMISRLPLVLIVHLKRFSTIGHFREKLETNVLVPTQKLYMQNYVTAGAQQSTVYNLYAVANHFGTLSSGHYTASVFNGLRDQWNYFDDTRVSLIPETQVATPAAYLLFFVQAQG